MCNIVIDLKNLEDKLFILDKKYYQYKYEKINYDESRYKVDTLEVNNKGLRINMIYNKEIKGKCRKCLL